MVSYPSLTYSCCGMSRRSSTSSAVCSSESTPPGAVDRAGQRAWGGTCGAIRRPRLRVPVVPNRRRCGNPAGWLLVDELFAAQPGQQGRECPTGERALATVRLAVDDASRLLDEVG